MGGVWRAGVEDEEILVEDEVVTGGEASGGVGFADGVEDDGLDVPVGFAGEFLGDAADAFEVGGGLPDGDGEEKG